MDKRILLRGCILGGAALGAAVSILIAVGQRPRSTPPPAQAVSSAETSPDAGYTVGQWEGLLAVYGADDDRPIEVYDIYIASLPPEEQARLSAGIPVENDTALARLLEDYTS